jgi:hypothetical protein
METRLAQNPGFPAIGGATLMITANLPVTVAGELVTIRPIFMTDVVKTVTRTVKALL